MVGGWSLVWYRIGRRNYQSNLYSSHKTWTKLTYNPLFIHLTWSERPSQPSLCPSLGCDWYKTVTSRDQRTSGWLHQVTQKAGLCFTPCSCDFDQRSYQASYISPWVNMNKKKMKVRNNNHCHTLCVTCYLSPKTSHGRMVSPNNQVAPLIVQGKGVQLVWAKNQKIFWNPIMLHLPLSNAR